MIRLLFIAAFSMLLFVGNSFSASGDIDQGIGQVKTWVDQIVAHDLQLNELDDVQAFRLELASEDQNTRDIIKASTVSRWQQLNIGYSYRRTGKRAYSTPGQRHPAIGNTMPVGRRNHAPPK